jgi:hypothetical protein
LVDAGQLNVWAKTQARDAQGTFPELMRRLLASTPGVTEISIRAGDGVAAPGWDGQARSAGRAAFLPAGLLLFEFGVGGGLKAKADADYAKRCDDPEAAGSAFIFATPNRWAGGPKWAQERRAEGVFCEVTVIDADDLEGWLQHTPAVHYWISEHLGRRPREAETLERWWERFRERTDPVLPAALFLAGRTDQREQLVEFFGGPPGVVTVRADWRDEAIAFMSATIESMNGAHRGAVQPSVVVSSAVVWDRIVTEQGPMTLLPLFDGPDIATALAYGHYVVLPAGRDTTMREATIELPRPHRQAAAEALQAQGLAHDRADALASLARRSMPALFRSLARDPRIARPLWTQPPDGDVLAPLVLVGSWTSVEPDTSIAADMAAAPWDSVERILMRWQATDDPPFVQSGKQWHLASAEEAFLVLRNVIAPGDLNRWRRIAPQVLLEADPALVLAPEEQVTAGVKGIGREHSEALRRGIVDGIALMGAAGYDRLGDGVTGADHARAIVRDVLDQASDDQSGLTWWSLADVLPALAEAAPQVFLDAVHDDLDRGHRSLLATMFQDHDESSWLYRSSPHTALLWAIETLCWSPDHLLEGARALARLHAVDPGGRLSNRPLASLHSVLDWRFRHTSAPLQMKMHAVGQICREMPNIGWQLLLALWPGDLFGVTVPHSPRFRDWRPGGRGPSMAECIDGIERVVILAIELADHNPARWANLVTRLGPLPSAHRERVLDTLDAVADPNHLDAAQRLRLWESLHKEIGEHRQFASADWSMDDAPLARMQAVADRIEPSDAPGRFGYLFDWRPSLPDVDISDHSAYQARLQQLRLEAVNDTLASRSLDGLRELAVSSPVPTHLGWAAGEVASEALTSRLLTWLDSEDPKIRETAAAWARRKLTDHGAAWLRDTLAHPEAAVPERQLVLALNAPPRGDVWDAIAEAGPDLEDAYWTDTRPRFVEPHDIERAVQELLARTRPWTAIDLLAAHTHLLTDERTRAPVELVMDALDLAITANPRDEEASLLGYEVGVLLDHLDARDADPEMLARYEFLFFRLTEHQRKPRALFRLMGSQPHLFVDLVVRVYQGTDEPRHDYGEREVALAHHAWWVLNNWNDLPGQRDDGTIDEEQLARWVRSARLELSDKRRADVGDEQIGQLLAASPDDPEDGAWPAQAVRDLIEAIGSTRLETGLHVGVINRRGFTWRGVYDGGQSERDLSGRYRHWATQTAGTWPRTARVLRGIADDYEHQAQHEDTRAQTRADTR